MRPAKETPLQPRSAFRRLLCHPGFIAVAAYLIRMGLLYHFHSLEPAFAHTSLPFGYELGRVARALAAGEGFSSPLRDLDSGPTAWFTPIYPLLVAAVFKWQGIYTFQSYLTLKAINLGFAALTCIPIFYIGRKSFSEPVGAWSAWLWAVLPAAIFFPLAWIWDMALSALLMALIFWATLEVQHSRRALAWAGYGALWTLGILTNPALLSVFPFLLLWAAWRARHAAAPWLRCLATATLVFIIGVAPWTIRNYRVFHRLIPLRSNFGLELWLGNNPQVPETWTWWLHPNDNPPEAQRYKQMGEMAYMEMKQREALAFMKSHPAEVARFLYHRFVENWLGITDAVSDIWPVAPWYQRGLVAINIFFTLFCLLGVLFAYRARSPAALPSALVLLAFPAVFYVTHSSLRYRFPIDPIMTVLTVYSVAYPITVFVRRRDRYRAAELAGDTTP